MTTSTSRAEPPIIVAAIVQRGDSILLVEERGWHDTTSIWMLPGGRVEPDEELMAALRRELVEETGLRLVGEPALAFTVDVEAALDDLAGRWHAMTFACRTAGALAPADPDGLVLAADWFAIPDAIQRLAAVEWYDAAPLSAFLDGSAPPGARYRYVLIGRRGAVARSAAELAG